VIACRPPRARAAKWGGAALITLRDGRKLGFISPFMIPKVAVCDPELTLGLPPGLTAATGMDAAHPLHRDLSLAAREPPADAIASMARSAPRAGSAPRSPRVPAADARWNMMMASLQGGLTFQKGLGAVHSMSHPLGGLKEPLLHHGTLNAVILPAVLRYNRGHARRRCERSSARSAFRAARPRDVRRALNARSACRRRSRRWASRRR
jgi:alcohol dehydrogenase class IV